MSRTVTLTNENREVIVITFMLNDNLPEQTGYHYTEHKIVLLSSDLWKKFRFKRDRRLIEMFIKDHVVEKEEDEYIKEVLNNRIEQKKYKVDDYFGCRYLIR